MAALSEGNGDRLRSADGRAFFPLRRSGRGPSRVFVGIDRHSPEAPPALGNRRAIPSVCHFACTSFLVAAVSAHWGIHGSFGEGGFLFLTLKRRNQKAPLPQTNIFRVTRWAVNKGETMKTNVHARPVNRMPAGRQSSRWLDPWHQVRSGVRNELGIRRTRTARNNLTVNWL